MCHRRFDRATRLYLVRYDDGDEETMSHKAIKACLKGESHKSVRALLEVPERARAHTHTHASRTRSSRA